jgi:hypothetical protein
VFLDIVRTNRFRDPLAISHTTGESGTSWLRPYARVDGLFWRIVPVEPVRTDPEVVRANLLDLYRYRGYADAAVRVDDVARTMGSLYYSALDALLAAYQSRGEVAKCREARERLTAAVPPDRVALSSATRARIEAHCRA